MNKTYKTVNTFYAVVSKKNEIYDISQDYGIAEDTRDSLNRIAETFKEDTPFRIEEIEVNTNLSF